ncbi:unnamed protein product [Brassica oleracea]|uniref:(rape) hypothetical protein n=1 Tax=Brassica napus TaxID=3708 RepID=A0A816ILD8_BRANA|nr:unnamed protein product [Brassica napus]
MKLRSVGMTNSPWRWRKCFKRLNRKKFCEQERFYNLEEDFYYLLQTLFISR